MRPDKALPHANERVVVPLLKLSEHVANTEDVHYGCPYDTLRYPYAGAVEIIT